MHPAGPPLSIYCLLICFNSGGELSKSKKELKWTEEDDGEGDPMFTEKTLELRQVGLGCYVNFLCWAQS